MKNDNIPAMAGLSSTNIRSNGTVTTGEYSLHLKERIAELESELKAQGGREQNPYVINNIGHRIWNPLDQEHVNWNGFYSLLKKGIDLSVLKINSHILKGKDNGKYDFDGNMSEADFLDMHTVGNKQLAITPVVENDFVDDDPLVGVVVNQAQKIEEQKRRLEHIEALNKKAKRSVIKVVRDLEEQFGLTSNGMPF